MSMVTVGLLDFAQPGEMLKVTSQEKAMEKGALSSKDMEKGAP